MLLRRITTCCLLAVAAVVSPAAEPEVGEAFPNLEEFGLEGEIPDTAAAKVVIVDFWASWCPPCKASFPVFDELHAEFAERGLVIIAVSVDQKAGPMKAFLKRTQPGFSVVHDAEQKLANEINLPSMPASYVLDSEGVLRFVHEGFHGEKSRELYRKQIQSLTEEEQ